MLLDTYQDQERFWLITLRGQTGTAGIHAFRGDLIVLPGEIIEAAGKRVPPRAVIKESVLLASADQLLFVAGNFASIDELPDFAAHLAKDLAPEAVPVFYVDNIAESAQVQIGDHRYVLIKFDDGMVWNNLIDEFYLEKGDLKGLSAEDKVVALYDAAKGHKHKYPERSLEQMQATKTGSRRETWGAV